MPNNLTDNIETQIIDAIHGTTPFPAVTTPMLLRLLTANGTEAAAGTQVTGGTYTPQPITMAPAAAGTTSNTTLIRFDGMPAATVVGVEVWDSSATARRIWYAPLTTPVTLTAGQPFEFPAGSLTFSLD